MKRNNIKLSVSRKLINRLSVRQRNRVMSEIRSGITVENSSCKASNNIDNNIQDISLINMSCNSLVNIDIVNNTLMEHNIDDELSSSSSCVSDVSFHSSHSDSISSLSSINNFEPSFRDRLASCFVNNNLTHVQGNSILSVLRTHPCFADLSKDVRTLLNPRNPAVVSNVEPGQYIIHFDLEASLVENLFNSSFVSSMKEIELDFNTDGCSLDKAGIIHIWPIQCRIVNLKCTKQ